MIETVTDTENKCYINSVKKGVCKNRKETCNQTLFARTRQSTLIHNAFIEITKQTLTKALFKATTLLVSLVLVCILAYKFQESLPTYF